MPHHLFDGNGRIFPGNMAFAGKTHRRHRTGVDHATHAAFLRRTDDCPRAFHIGAIHLLRVAYPQPIIGGNVKYKVAAGHALLQRLGIAQITRCSFSPQVGNVVQAAGGTDEQPQLRALRSQRSRHVAADKSRRSCDEGLHGFLCPEHGEGTLYQVQHLQEKQNPRLRFQQSMKSAIAFNPGSFVTIGLPRSARDLKRTYSSASAWIPIFFSPAAFFSQYLRTQASNLFPAAVSRPLKANAAISEYGMDTFWSASLGNSRTAESASVLPVRLPKIYPSTLLPSLRVMVTSPR